MATIEPTAVNSNGTRYGTADNLGSPRVVTNSSGGVVSRHDYKAFGEELFSGTGGRTVGMGFSVSDGNRNQFTGYERDNETGLDFAQARYNSSTLGRFTSPDPYSGSMSAADPQSFNRYAYVGNNPLTHVDPSGLAPDGGPGGFLPGAEGALGRANPGGGLDPISARDASYDHMLTSTQMGAQIISFLRAWSRGFRAAQLAQQAYSINASMVVIWDSVSGVNPDRWFGHVSYITLEDDQSYSWQGFWNWTKDHPSSNYTNLRSKDSAGMGYILDFGSKINEKFQSALTHALRSFLRRLWTDQR